MRDAQRQRVYEAEAQWVQTYGRGASFGSVEACQAYVDRVLRPHRWRLLRRWLLTHWHWVPQVHVVRGRQGCSAHASGKRITLPPWAWNSAVVLHELAHVLTPGREPGHGRLYAHNYLVLVRRMLGRAAAAALRQAFREHRVAYRPQQRHLSYLVVRSQVREAACKPR